MIKVVCDLCGGEILDFDQQTCLSFESYGVSGGLKKQYQLHASCGHILKNRLDSMMKIRQTEEAMP